MGAARDEDDDDDSHSLAAIEALIASEEARLRAAEDEVFATIDAGVADCLLSSAAAKDKRRRVRKLTHAVRSGGELLDVAIIELHAQHQRLVEELESEAES